MNSFSTMEGRIEVAIIELIAIIHHLICLPFTRVIYLCLSLSLSLSLARPLSLILLLSHSRPVSLSQSPSPPSYSHSLPFTHPLCSPDPPSRNIGQLSS